jgi:predicted enzyme related to lactoylglutathione lyase
MRAPHSPVVHLELHTSDLDRACDFYARALGWRTERLSLDSGSYLALGLGREIEGGVVECRTSRPLWLPYVEVADLAVTTERARELGADVLLEPREGPAGWRGVIAPQAGGELGLWQSKTR